MEGEKGERSTGAREDADLVVFPLQVLAKRRVDLLRIQHRKKMEAEKLRLEEEERLKKEKHLKSAEARKEADRRYQVLYDSTSQHE